MSVIIRTIQPEDACAFLNLGCQINRETKFMLHEPGERTTSIEEQRKRIETQLARDNTMIFVAEVDGELVGFLMAYGGSYQRNRHTVYIVIGILEAYTGQGIGRRLFEHMETWARGWGAHRLELTVMTHNQRAVALYRKMGFEIEGIHTHSLKVDGEYVDEYGMSKILT